MKKYYVVFAFLLIALFCSGARLTFFNMSPVYHRSLQGLSYEESGHVGFLKRYGDAAKDFICGNAGTFGTINASGDINFTGAPSGIMPNNASFTLNGLLNKDFEYLTDKPVTFEGYGITDGIDANTFNSHNNATQSIHGVTGILSSASLSQHINIGSYSVHGMTNIVDETIISDSSRHWPWLNSCRIWANATSTTPFNNSSVCSYDNKLWAVGGYYTSYKNYVYYSTNGINWTCATTSANFSPRTDACLIVFNNKMWLIGGSIETGLLNDVWYSSNGINWTCATTSANFSPRINESLCVYKDKIWLFGGNSSTSIYYHDIWSSSDGINWSCVSTNSDYIKAGANILVYQNRIWIMNGRDVSPVKIYQSVYTTSDGITYGVATTSSGIGERENAGCFVYDDKMWVCFGNPYDYTDLWYSTNGVNWTCATTTWGFPTLYMPYCKHPVVFKDKVWIYSYNNFTWNNYNNCYYTVP